jgi:excisionase family DNA binding protein
MTLTEVRDELGMSGAQVYALVRSGDLPAIKIGGRGQWRVERSRFEEWIKERYAETVQWIKEHPFGATVAEEARLNPDVGGDVDHGRA